MAIKLKKKVRFYNRSTLNNWLKQRKYIYREGVTGKYRYNKGMFQYNAGTGWRPALDVFNFELVKGRFYKYV